MKRIIKTLISETYNSNDWQTSYLQGLCKRNTFEVTFVVILSCFLHNFETILQLGYLSWANEILQDLSSRCTSDIYSTFEQSQDLSGSFPTMMDYQVLQRRIISDRDISKAYCSIVPNSCAFAHFKLQPVRLSVYLSVRPSVTPFPLLFQSKYHLEIFRSYYQWQKWCLFKRSRSDVKGQMSRSQRSKAYLAFPDRNSHLNSHMIMKPCKKLDVA